MNDLSGILVVSVEQAVAGPLTSCRLADAGARVIKVERPEGDFARYYDDYVKGESAYFVWVNRGKESICLDLTTEPDRQVLRAMLAKADVFIQNLSPGAIDRLGFAPAALRASHPRLITCSISGYGEDGPYRDQKAYDLLVQAETGLTELTGNEAGSARVGVSVCDIAAGMTAYQGILEALIGRSRTGVGRHLSVSLYHALADWMNVPYLQYRYGGERPQRLGLNHPTIAPYGAYRCGDGSQVLFSVQNQREWTIFCDKVLCMPELETDPRFHSNDQRVINRPMLDTIIDGLFQQLTSEEAVGLLGKAGIAFGRVTDIEDLGRHPQNRYLDVETPAGPVRLLSPGLTHDGEVHAARNVPAPGADGSGLRREFLGDGTPGGQSAGESGTS